MFAFRQNSKGQRDPIYTSSQLAAAEVVAAAAAEAAAASLVT